jgi:4-amino-4-deoxy-L-arabinose transferase-like glycosyltransferase
VEAFSLFHFGVDRNGLAYPVHFISWGSGQNALYAYLLLPFMVLGLNPVTVRLPMLLTGILTLPLLYFAARPIAGRNFALIAMFLLAISPWHIMLSRWGLESNVLPFIFLASFAALVRARPGNAGFLAACIGLALCLYAYGTAYAAVPVFLALAISILLIYKRVRVKQLMVGLAVFGLLAIPLGLFIAVNTWQWDTLQLGPVSIPRLPVRPRYETMSALFSDDAAAALTDNLRTMFNLLQEQTDGLIWNALHPYGYFYAITFPVAALGALLLIPFRTAKNAADRWLLLA